MGRSVRQRTNHGVGPYPTNWKDIADSVKERAGWRCVRCLHPHETSKTVIERIRTCVVKRHPVYIELNKSIRIERNPRCSGCNGCDELCRHEPDGKQRMLTVHHLDCDPSNCADWNLAALCQKCHLEIQGRVDFVQSYMFDHSEWMIPYVEGFLAYTRSIA